MHFLTSATCLIQTRKFTTMKKLFWARFQVLSALLGKITVNWDVTPCKWVHMHRYKCFGRNCCLHLQGILKLLWKLRHGMERNTHILILIPHIIAGFEWGTQKIIITLRDGLWTDTGMCHLPYRTKEYYLLHNDICMYYIHLKYWTAFEPFNITVAKILLDISKWRNRLKNDFFHFFNLKCTLYEFPFLESVCILTGMSRIRCMFNLKNKLNMFYTDTISKSGWVLDSEEWNLSLQSVLLVCQNGVKFQIYFPREFP